MDCSCRLASGVLANVRSPPIADARRSGGRNRSGSRLPSRPRCRATCPGGLPRTDDPGRDLDRIGDEPCEGQRHQDPQDDNAAADGTSRRVLKVVGGRRIAHGKPGFLGKERSRNPSADRRLNRDRGDRISRCNTATNALRGAPPAFGRRIRRPIRPLPSTETAAGRSDTWRLTPGRLRA